MRRGAFRGRKALISGKLAVRQEKNGPRPKRLSINRNRFLLIVLALAGVRDAHLQGERLSRLRKRTFVRQGRNYRGFRFGRSLPSEEA